MNLKTFIIKSCVTLLIPIQVFASGRTTEASHCETCLVQTANGPRMKNNLGYVATTLGNINDKLDWGQKCENFVDESTLGKWAQEIRSVYMSSDFSNLDEGAKDIHRLCPTYKEMKPTDKANFWVLVLNAMAHYESTCNKAVTAKGPNGSLVGLLQLHNGREGVYSKGCDNGDGQTTKGTFRCALSMINDQIRREDELFSRKSYWDVLRPQAKSQRVPKISKAILAYTPCHDESKLNVRQASNNANVIEALQAMDVKKTNSYDM
ncbi:hypothetical protein QJS83_08650 [Bdellovibrio sp. 22V]|uniref:hypothetical protein n=1 Tax=Bdellovibrio sp. 22V TaxID=3044166 RepID=UPI0025434181|nr:hypothetical protein [Bdellovibrio sp. 22V]WII70525.1 hypothetical protein QJS83_08650 [Bdellovibrio sp. 22V]